MGLRSFLFGKGPQATQLPTVNPQQQMLMDWLLSQGKQGLGQDAEFNFEPIEKQAMTQFNSQIIPSIAERFAGTGARNSSAFQSALGQAGAGLAENLAALKAQYGFQGAQNRQQNALNMLGMGLRPTFENLYSEESPGLLGGLLPSLSHYGAQYGMQSLFGGMGGAGAGAAGAGAAGTGAAGAGGMMASLGAAAPYAIPAALALGGLAYGSSQMSRKRNRQRSLDRGMGQYNAGLLPQPPMGY